MFGMKLVFKIEMHSCFYFFEILTNFLESIANSLLWFSIISIWLENVSDGFSIPLADFSNIIVGGKIMKLLRKANDGGSPFPPYPTSSNTPQNSWSAAAFQQVVRPGAILFRVVLI